MDTTIRVDKSYVEVLEDLQKKFEIGSRKEFIESAIQYFHETGISPKSKIKSTSDELAKLRKTIVSFIREQEKKKLNPIIEQINDVMVFLKQYVQEEALTKNDLKSALQLQRTSSSITEKERPVKTDTGNSRELDIENEKQQNLVKHAKGLFAEFSKHFKSSAFGGYSVDKTIVEKYKSLFEKL